MIPPCRVGWRYSRYRVNSDPKTSQWFMSWKPWAEPRPNIYLELMPLRLGENYNEGGVMVVVVVTTRVFCCCWKKHRAVYLIRSIIWLKFWMWRTNSSSVKLYLYIYFCVVHLSRPCFGVGPILFVQQMDTWCSHATPITVEFDITWCGCEVLRVRRWRCTIPLHLGTSKKLFDWPMSTLWCLLWVHQSYVIVWMHSLLGISWLE